MKWYLLFYVWVTPGIGIDPCMSQGVCYNKETRVEMPSLEVCRQVRAVNQNSKCISEAID